MDISTVLNKVKKYEPFILGHEQFFKSAILLPLVIKDGEIHILFEVRSLKLKRQPGEICFPGGRMEKYDQTEAATAIRETSEELGIDKNAISNVCPIDFLVTPFGMIVYPYVGVIEDFQAIKPNEEVEEIFTVPLSFLMETTPQIHTVNVQIQPEEDFPYELIVGGKKYNWRTRKIEEYFYVYEDKVIWGLTARILAHFIELMKK